MSRSILFILALLCVNLGFACGYYPYGEDVRMCFFRPQYYNFGWYSEFYYTARYFNEDDVAGEDTPNDYFWFNYCKGKVPIPSVKEAVYALAPGELTARSTNSMVKYLFSIKDTEAINYLQFAKDCEPGNDWSGDPWERHQADFENKRQEFIEKAISRSKSASNNEIRQRYVFLAIRMAFYNGRGDTVRQLFEDTFAGNKKKGLVYHWALYFYTIFEKNPAKASCMAAQVFANAPDKRFAVYSHFDKNIPLASILKYASSDSEKANVYALAAISKHDRALEYIRQVHKLDPANRSLGFLMLREVNKLEDWIYTPYYTLFAPSLEDSYQSYTEQLILNRVEEDRAYAAEVLAFVNTIEADTQYWTQVRAQLEFMTGQYGQCLMTINNLRKILDAGSGEANQLELIYALALTASQPYGKAVIPEEVKPILLKNKEDQRFVFALARELEYKGNTTDAALLYTNLVSPYSKGENRWSDIYWKDGRGLEAYADYHTDWFGYLNVNYTPEQVQLLINAIKSAKVVDEFSGWKYKWISGKLPVLYDLLGTKLMRQNRLEEACAAFSMAGDRYWDYNYGFWERPSFFGGGNQFDKNPFYTLNDTHVVPQRKFMKLNKYTVTKSLVHYLRRAEDLNENDRDFFYFLVANCYFNMTDYGNSWMMRRFFQSSNEVRTGLEDEEEYYHCNLAKRYYEKAYNVAKTDKFRALCLKMMAICEHNSLLYNMDEQYDYKSEIPNKYSRMLKMQYPVYYNDMSYRGCESFEKYFASRR